MGDRLRLRQAQVDCDPAAALRIRREGAPVGDAAALRTEVKPERVAAHVCLGGARNVDAFALVSVCPQPTIPATRRAVARGRRLRQALELPMNRSTKT